MGKLLRIQCAVFYNESNNLALVGDQPVHDLANHLHDRVVLDEIKHLNDDLFVFLHGAAPFLGSSVGGDRLRRSPVDHGRLASLSLLLASLCGMAFRSVNAGTRAECVPLRFRTCKNARMIPFRRSEYKDGGALFKLRLAEYINTNMREQGITYKRLEQLSGVPQTSLHSYAQAKVSNPDEDNLVRIAVAFGDDPEVIQRMRRETLDSTAKENQIIARSGDKERMEEFASLIRSSVAKLLEEYREQSAAQQTEIIQHADARVETERQRFKSRAEEVLRQCLEETQREKEACAEKIDMTKEHCRQLIDHEQRSSDKIAEENAIVRKYLKTVIRNLTIALIVVSIIAIIGLSALGGYSFYAYHTFDREDPTRGLYRAEVTVDPAETPYTK